MSLAAILSIVFSAVVTAFLAVLGWVARAMLEVRDGQRDLRSLLVGIDGKNGMRSEVHTLRVAKHEQADAIHALSGRVGLAELRIEHLEGK